MAVTNVRQVSPLTEETVRTVSEIFSEPSWLLKSRLKAWKALSSMEPPRVKYGLGIETNVSSVNPGALGIVKTAQLHSQDKDMCTEQCQATKEIVILDLHTAAKVHSGLVKTHLFSLTSPEDNWYNALNAALWTRGIFVHIPKGVMCRDQLQFQLGTKAENMVDRLLIIAEEKSSGSVVEFVQGSGSGFRSHAVEVVAIEDARVTHATVQTLGDEAVHLSRRMGRAGADSRIDWIDCCIGSKLAVTDISNNLKGQGAEGYVHGLFYGSGKQYFDIHNSTVHNAPDTQSNMHTKGVLTGRARSLYHGMVKITEDAPRSNGFQKEEALLLSNEARADAIPQLEIGNNDVSCTHGATIGQVDADKVFYLMSRGLSKQEAMKTIVNGFFEPLLLRICRKTTQQELRELIHSKVDEYSQEERQ